MRCSSGEVAHRDFIWDSFAGTIGGVAWCAIATLYFIYTGSAGATWNLYAQLGKSSPRHLVAKLRRPWLLRGKHRQPEKHSRRSARTSRARSQNARRGGSPILASDRGGHRCRLRRHRYQSHLRLSGSRDRCHGGCGRCDRHGLGNSVADLVVPIPACHGQIRFRSVACGLQR